METSLRSQTRAFAVMDILGEAMQRAAAGQDIINLCAGEPTSGTPQPIKLRAARQLATGDLGYTQSSGLPELRSAIAGHYQRAHNLEISPDNIVITTGSSGAFMLAFLASFDVGDRVALASPGYPAYRNILQTLGCEVVDILADAEDNYQPTIAQLEALDEPVKGLLIASPANPTGAIIPADQLAELARWCGDNGVRLISDEIYHGVTFGDEEVATVAAHLDQGAVVVNSFSKYWAMTGWRLGWLVLPDNMVRRVDVLSSSVSLCPPAISQHAALAGFSDEMYAINDEVVASYERNYELLVNRFAELGWGEYIPAAGGFYMYANISTVTDLHSQDWCRLVLEETGVALTPGTDFDPQRGGDWVRLSFSLEYDKLNEAIDRLVAFQSAQGAAAADSDDN